ncbi:unnamed protein product [Euphydryas editha]|uniref:Cortactin n=1 Tax=Euphydryas editha TaxID=104508 RepID=A0AAU9U7L0_EUPED|nr:unnamed protein product [Euphydryas editha]
MWKAATGVTAPAPADADDWETDPDFVNDVTEQEQRWGPGGRHVEAIDMAKLREEVFEADKKAKQKEYEEGPKPSFGYGGKFGVQEDRMDKSAVGHDYVGKTEKHVSQKDYAQGFGGKFGVQTDRMDASAVGHDYVGKVEKHASQSDYAKGFGGKYGVQTDRVDKSAAGWEHREKVEKHPSQKDYSVGFGGRFGVQADRRDASAAGWDTVERAPAHRSQKGNAIRIAFTCTVSSVRRAVRRAGGPARRERGRLGHRRARARAPLAEGRTGATRARPAGTPSSARPRTARRRVMRYVSPSPVPSLLFGGRFGVQADRRDASAAGWDTVERAPAHRSQKGNAIRIAFTCTVSSVRRAVRRAGGPARRERGRLGHRRARARAPLAEG